jgi:chromosome transmission fidelity protein 4
MVCVYSLETNQYEKMLIRCTLPIRDIAISPDGRWAAVASDELTVKIVNIQDPESFTYIRDIPKPAKHLTYDSSGSYLAISCSDGIVYFYKLSTDQPELSRKVEGLIRQLETDSIISSKAVWHPDGRVLALPTVSRDVQVVSFGDGEKQRSFASGHTGDITALAWSPNGAMLLTSATDKKIILWETKSQKVLARYDYANVVNIVWHPDENVVSFATSDGEIFIYQDFLQPEHIPLLKLPLQLAPFIHDPLAEIDGNTRKASINNIKTTEHRRRQGTPDSLDDILGPESDDDVELDDFVVDDDGAGYATGVNGNGKRTNGHLDDSNGYGTKRRAIWQPNLHDSFQPGSTPWRGNRRYLCKSFFLLPNYINRERLESYWLRLDC